MADSFEHRMDELDIELKSLSAYTLWTKRFVAMCNDLSEEADSAWRYLHKQLKQTPIPDRANNLATRTWAAKSVTSGIRRGSEKLHASGDLAVRSYRTFTGLYVVRSSTAKIEGMNLDA